MRNSILLFTIICLPLSVQSAEVSKTDWVNSMTIALPTVFCNSSQYFRQCFSVSAQECEETAASSTRVCLNKNINNIPNVLVQPKDGMHWGAIIGKCAGEAYELALAKKRINNSKCNDVSNWQ